MKRNSLLLVSLTVGLVLAFAGGCASPSSSSAADPAQVAKISAVAGAIVQTGASAVLAKNPDSKAELLAVAEAIEQAAALPQAPAPSNLLNLTSAAAAKFGGPYGALAGLGLQAGFALYQNFYAANTASALDKQPAFKAVLVAMASGIRAAAAGVPQPVASLPDLPDSELVLRPAR